ncbi:hypothetical protein JVT61DRAFT_3099 [Boletus reticuloceps]|uniref:Uncharacterized protein n=1 Tax=Boletus reticuloceps TaxID=495285 RepID=A0A8I2YP31_9AGAM|nr:hypothetical protein JVT61DRAFT_3099 [Boletus reticuloceps]
MALPPPGTHLFLPSLLTHVRSAAPGFPLEPVIVQVLLICIISGNKNLILRTRDEDIPLVSKLTTLALNTIFGYNTHRLKCHSGTANQSPSEFLRSLLCASSAVATPPTDNLAGSLHKHRHRRVSNSRNSAGKSPIAPSTSISTARSRRTSLSRSTSHPVELKPSIATLGRPQSDSGDPDSKPFLNAEVYSQRPSLHPPGTQTDTSVPTLASSVKTHFRNLSRGSTEALKLPSAVVVSGLEFASLPSQKAVLRTLAERKIIVSDGGIFGHDQDGLTFELPHGFFIVYVCRSDPRDRPPIYKSLVCHEFFRRRRSTDSLGNAPISPPFISLYNTLVTAHLCSLRGFPDATFIDSLIWSVHASRDLGLSSDSSALLHRLKHLCATQAHIRPSLNIYLADLFSATRHYGPLDSMMLTARARQDAETLIRASRVLGTDHTGAELIKEHAERSRETDGTSSTYPHSQPSVASTSSDALVDGFDGLEMREPFGGSSPPSTEQLKLDVSEADIARIFPRAVSHRIRVRDSPFDEILSSAVCGAIVRTLGNEPHEKETLVQWERETVKDILVHILSEV